MHVIFVAEKEENGVGWGKIGTKSRLGMTQKGCGLAKNLRFIKNVLCAKKLNFLHSRLQLSVFPNKSFLFSQKQHLTKLPVP